MFASLRSQVCLSSLCCLLVAGGCELIPIATGPSEPVEPAAALPSKETYRVSQFVFSADFKIQRNLPIFRELGELREQVYKDLHLPPSNTLIHVYLFEDQKRFERFIKAKYPNLPERRAFFVADPRRPGRSEDLLVYTYWGDRIQQDLRHELTHALLHSVLKDVPLWLDEGLAECFEMPPGWNAVNVKHVQQLRQPGVKFNLDRLEGMNDVKDMSAAEYREAWAWTHLMLRGTPQARQILIAYLQELRSNPRPAALRPRLAGVHPELESALQRHLERLESTKPK